MKYPAKLLTIGLLFLALSCFCVFEIHRCVAIVSAMNCFQGENGSFQFKLAGLAGHRERTDAEQQLDGLLSQLQSLGGMGTLYDEFGGEYGDKIARLKSGLEALKASSGTAVRGIDSDNVRELRQTADDLSQMSVRGVVRNVTKIRWYAVVWLSGTSLLLLAAFVVHWFDYRRRMALLSCELAIASNDGNAAPQYQRLVDLSDVEPALKRYLEQNGQRVQGQESFLAEMSHEIRTPLNGVIGFLSNLGETSLNSQQKQYVRIIESSAHSLMHVINEILDYSKINAGGLELEDVAFDLRSLAEDRMAMAGQLAKSKNLKTSLLFPGHGPAIVRGDPHRLRQVLDNLLGNAVRFTERGEVCLEIQIGNHENGQLLVDFAVKDTGVGIPAANLPKLFKPFKQADNSVSRKYGGTGLGLCISHSLVELMGGKLEVWSRQGEGSRFYFLLTMAQARAEEQVRLPGNFRITLPRNELKKHMALLVDDTPTNLFLLETVCQSVGLPYRTAVNGAEAVELCLKQKFDIIFMDIQMPVMDGYTAIREIRKLPNSAMTSIIALTASTFQEDVERALGAGSTGFIAKPFERNQLLMCIADALVIEPIRESIDEEEAVESEDEATVRNMHDFMREQYQISLGEIKMTLAQTVADWRPMLDSLRIYAKKGNAAETKSILHRLKGQLASIGLPTQSEQAALIMECIADNEITEQVMNSIEDLIRDLGRIFKQLEQDVTVIR